MVLRDCTRKLDSDFNIRALNAVRAAALAKKKENEKIVVHVTLLKPFEWNQKREVKIKFKNKISYCESALYVIPGKRFNTHIEQGSVPNIGTPLRFYIRQSFKSNRFLPRYMTYRLFF